MVYELSNPKPHAPTLECSSRGDSRYSAFYARIRSMNNHSIESLYQSYKLGASEGVVVINWKSAKGTRSVKPMPECHLYYDKLWDLYFEENPELVTYASNYGKFSDLFGRPKCCCQAKNIRDHVERALVLKGE